jgi:NADPH:quinone reductase-like Zn-dependent oxidoreductase
VERRWRIEDDDPDDCEQRATSLVESVNPLEDKTVLHFGAGGGVGSFAPQCSDRTTAADTVKTRS